MGAKNTLEAIISAGAGREKCRIRPCWLATPSPSVGRFHSRLSRARAEPARCETPPRRAATRRVSFGSMRARERAGGGGRRRSGALARGPRGGAAVGRAAAAPPPPARDVTGVAARERRRWARAGRLRAELGVSKIANVRTCQERGVARLGAAWP